MAKEDMNFGDYVEIGALSIVLVFATITTLPIAALGFVVHKAFQFDPLKTLVK